METQEEPLIAEGPVLLALEPAGLARIRLNRPAAANGLNIELLSALQSALMIVHGDKRVRAVLLTGAGKNFCAGGDVHTFAAKGTDLPYYIRQATANLQIAISSLVHLNVPVVTAVQGFAAGGGGLGLVCGSDIVIAAASAKFLAGATRVGMAPDAGSSVALVQLVGFRRAMEMLLTNNTVTAPEALAIGLITCVVPDEELEDAALDTARTLASGATQALGATKRLLWSGIGLGLDAAMPEESRTVAQLSGTADAREGLAAVIEKRAPRFTGQ